MARECKDSRSERDRTHERTRERKIVSEKVITKEEDTRMSERVREEREGDGMGRMKYVGGNGKNEMLCVEMTRCQGVRKCGRIESLATRDRPREV